MSKLKLWAFKLSPAMLLLGLAGTVKASYASDAMDVAITSGVTSIYDRIMEFFTENLGTIFLIVGSIIVLFFAIRVVKRTLGR